MNEALSIKFQGKIFQNELDLRDIAFFGKKISNITDKAYSAYTGKSNDLKNKYKIITKEIKHASLDFQLLLDYGIALTPVLMEHHTTVWNTASLAIDMIAKMGEIFGKGKNVTISLENSSITNLVITNGDVTISMPIPAYQTMLNIDNDIKELNKKVSNGEISSFSVNERKFMSIDTVDNINKGLEYIETLKEETISELFKAELSIYEFNKNTMTGKAILGKNNLFGIETKDNVDLDIPENCIDKILSSMSGDKILVNFEAIIENIVSRKILKRIIIKNCEK
ncbi:hypothetical protein [Aliarcobacter butzleri]|uniref:hypothetical protein n=1 Tax=Aliarcobacter butzleri TaxID=28197 RepID=UPI0018A03A7D|nr:hypothetical protein [Aliarcobacter butzleri]MBF7065783.1 hypothetical protein [Aliarcobacter butzleri]